MTLHAILPPFSVILTFLTLGVTYGVRRRSHSTLGLLLLPASALVPVVADLTGLRLIDPESLREAYAGNLAGDFLAAAFLLLFGFTYARKDAAEDLRKGKGMLIPGGIAILLSMGIAFVNPHLVRVVLLGGGSTVLFLGEATATFLSLFLIALLLFGLYQISRTYLAASGMERWNIKYPMIGVTLWTLSVLILHSAQIMEDGFDRSYFLLEVVGLLLLDLFFLYAFLIQRAQEVRLALSRTMINRSFLLLSGGMGLIVLGGLATSLSGLGPIWSKLSGSMMVLLGISLFLVVFTSDRLRKEIEDFLGIHLYSDRYDYRAAWMSLTRALSESKSLSDLVPTLLDQTREIAFADSIVYCQVTSTPPVVVIPQQASGLSVPVLSEEDRMLDASLVALLSEGLPIPLSEIGRRLVGEEEIAAGKALFRHLKSNWILPLVVQGRMIGFLGLWSRSSDSRSLFEDRLFLQALSVQWGSLLYNAALSRELAWSREADLLSGLKAFAFHDLKNSGIALKLLLHNATRHIASPEFQQELIQGIQNVSEQISATVEQFLSPFHQEFTRQTSFDPNELIRTTLQGLSWGSLQDLKVEIDLAPLPMVSGNPKSFESTIRNLLINAREAMDSKGIIHIESRSEPGSGVRILVSDNGPGMSREFMETRLFRPFQTTKKKGSGLGLFSVKLLIEQIGGSIDVDSEEGVGTRFMIRLPIQAMAMTERE
ncbi:MAG: ATP-binding protein [Nitrospirota bacterium]|nr:ATP-binding protein [Nitrospirota bacterium]